ncbi:MAG: response regulator [Acidobacteriota bacterium]|nr:MAG: response regulator [Acidobacteriota bacterium]
MPGHGEDPARVLLVDDDVDVRETLAQALMIRSGLEVAIAADAFEAGYRFAKFRPHVVILDVVMPGMGGFDICERMRRMAGSTQTKIIILTGYPLDGNPERSVLSGADMFLTKPQDIDTLVTHINDLLGL